MFSDMFVLNAKAKVLLKTQEDFAQGFSQFFLVFNLFHFLF